MLFERACDDGRIVRDRVERKHVPQEAEKADMVVPLQAVNGAGGLVGKIDVGRLEFVVKDALKVDQLVARRRLAPRGLRRSAGCSSAIRRMR